MSAEVILVDNGSSDGSAALVRAEFPSVRLIALEENIGFAAGNNAGLREASGRLLLLLNTDTEVPQGALCEMVARMACERTIGILGCQHYDRDGRRQVCHAASFPGPLRGCLAVPVGGSSEGIGDAAWVSGACMLARRELYDQVGGLDEEYPLYYEDVDWCFRAWQSGWRVVWAPDIAIVHDVGGSSGQMLQSEKRTWQLISESLFYRKHCAPGRVWLWWIGGAFRRSRRVIWGCIRCCVWPRRRALRRLGGHLGELSAFLKVGCRLWRRRTSPPSGSDVRDGAASPPADRPRDASRCEVP
jgi:GT2 family glycosyltransferase